MRNGEFSESIEELYIRPNLGSHNKNQNSISVRILIVFGFYNKNQRIQIVLASGEFIDEVLRVIYA